MKINRSDTLGSIVNRDHHAARVFSKHGLDFCFGESMTLSDACHEASVSTKLLLNELANIKNPMAENLPDFSAMAIDELTIFIQKFYHHYTEESALFIRLNIARLRRVHGPRYPELEAIGEIFEEMTSRLAIHMKHEEFLLFPYIRKMVRHGSKGQNRIFKSVKSPIAVMIRDHENEGEQLKKLDALTHHYTVPDSACTIFKVTYAAMRELHENINDHLDVENNILFPKAQQMEQSFSKC